jgi:hypothetical protein
MFGLQLLELFTQRDRGRTVLRVARHRRFDDIGDITRDTAFAKVWRRLTGDTQKLRHDLLAAASFERGVPRQRGEQRGAQAVYVDARLAGSPLRISGAVNAGDPVNVPVAVLNPPVMWAIPKSLSAGSP